MFVDVQNMSWRQELNAIREITETYSAGSIDWNLEVAKGNIAGISHVNKFGSNDAVGTSSIEVWHYNSPYTFLSSEATLYASSSNAGDTQDIIVEVLNGSDWTESIRTVTLSGQTQVAIPGGTIIRVNRAYNDGSTLAGDVYIAESDTLTGGVPNTASKIKAYIEAEEGQTSQAIYTVPAGKTAYLTEAYFAAGKGQDVFFRLLTRKNGKQFLHKLHINLLQTNFNRYWRRPDSFPEMTDMKITASTSSGTVSSSAGFDLLLIDN